MMLNLTDAQVVLARVQKHSDNNGAYIQAIVFDEKIDHVFFVGGIYDSLELDDPGFQKMASDEQRKKANVIWQKTKMDCCVVNNETTYIGCIVKLARCRNAPNNIPLLVTNFKSKQWNNKFYSPAMIEVENFVTLERAWVSKNGVREVIAGKPAWWA